MASHTVIDMGDTPDPIRPLSEHFWIASNEIGHGTIRVVGGAWLVERNDLPERTPTRGYGKAFPVAPNTNPDGSDNPAGRQKNRRVETVINKSKES